MSERTAILILVIGVILVVAAVFGISVVAMTQGMVSLPPDGLASTPYSLTGYIVGYALVLSAAGIIVRLILGPRKPPARTTSSHLSGAGRVYTPGQVRMTRLRATAKTRVMPRVVGAAETAFLPSRAAVPTVPPGHGRPPLLPTVPPRDRHGRAVAASVPGCDVEAATTQAPAWAMTHAQPTALPVMRPRPERGGASHLSGHEPRRDQTWMARTGTSVYRSRSAVTVRRSGPADVPAGRRLSALATVAVAAVLLAGIAQLLTGGLW